MDLKDISLFIVYHSFDQLKDLRALDLPA